MIRSKWDQRIRRADQLAAEHPFAAEVLRFYIWVVRLQKDLYADMPDGSRFPGFLTDIASVAPEPLAQSARSLKQCRPAYWQGAFAKFLSDVPSFQPQPGREA